MRVGVFGAAGRVGSTVCQAVAAEPDMDLVPAVDPALAGTVLHPSESALTVAGDWAELARAGAEVAVDFTVADAAIKNIGWCAEHEVHAVVGTTGFSEPQLQLAEELFSQSSANCVVAPNFAIGAVLMMRFAELAAPFMDGVEIVELHHNAKADAPSGTAIATAEAIARGRARSGSGDWARDATDRHTIAGTRGGKGPGGVSVHALRIPGLVSHQEVVMGATGQSLIIRHDSYDRTSFMPGVLLAIRSVAGRPGLTRGLAPLLGL